MTPQSTVGCVPNPASTNNLVPGASKGVYFVSPPTKNSSLRAKLTTPKLPRRFASGLVGESDSGVPKVADLLEPLGLTAARVDGGSAGESRSFASIYSIWLLDTLFRAFTFRGLDFVVLRHALGY